MGKTLFEKIWDQHVVKELPGGEVLLYIDRHLIHEVTSPQAFEGLSINNRPVRHPELTFATTDHNVPTDSRVEIKDPVARTLDCTSGKIVKNTVFDFMEWILINKELFILLDQNKE